ncbi:MAG: nucleotidyltransferase [Planctomycetes bacterium]|nr:nucleotidyltransferase [Planctomycetota bacterium]MCW8139348.1 nucleotidyltransferase [Planctomycetota bacterium]
MAEHLSPERMEQFSRILGDLADDLDVPPSKYEEAKEHYDAVGAWLNDSPDLAALNPTIYPQGSFALGTAIKPVGDGDYDVDAVCVLQLSTATTTQHAVKTLVGDRLKENKTYARMLHPKAGGRRCWTLKYADSSNFHLDILPAVPDSQRELVRLGVPPEIAKYAICITDRELWAVALTWPRSNPQGYVEWFKSRMRVVFEERRQLRALEIRASVQDIQDYQVRTPLQRLIQLLKPTFQRSRPCSAQLCVCQSGAESSCASSATGYFAFLALQPRWRGFGSASWA